MGKRQSCSNDWHMMKRLAGRLVLLRGLGPERETGVEAGEKQKEKTRSSRIRKERKRERNRERETEDEIDQNEIDKK